MENEVQKYKLRDISYNWERTSTFFFYVTVFCFLAFLIGGSIKLYRMSYKGHPDVEVPESTLYTPKYK